MHLTTSLHKALIEKPQATALICGERRHSFEAFVQRVARLASVLRGLGVRQGDRVGLLALNSDRYIEYLYASWWAGGVINPVNVRWSPQEVAFSLDDCGTQLLLCDAALLALARGLQGRSRSLRQLAFFDEGRAPEGLIDVEALMARAEGMQDLRCGGDALAAVMYTGGTTGRPKGVMLTHDNLFIGQLSTLAATQRSPEAVGINTAPLFHVGGVGLALQLMLRLCPQVVMRQFDELAFLQTVQREHASETFLVPTMLKRVIEHPRFADFDTRSLGTVLYGAAPIDEALLRQAQAAWPQARYCQVYGMTELSPVISALPAEAHASDAPAARRRSAGRAVPIAELRIVDAQDQPLPVGAVGEIVARGPMVMAGYWGQPEQTAQALRGGWMHTGDGGYLDEDGYVYVVDRLKDMVISGGENVYSAEVENAIALLPQVSMCAVIGLPDAQWGERVHAVVVLREGQALSAEALIAHCRAQIAGYKCPRSVDFRPELPLSAAGKVLKHRLRESLWEAVQGAELPSWGFRAASLVRGLGPRAARLGPRRPLAAARRRKPLPVRA